MFGLGIKETMKKFDVQAKSMLELIGTSDCTDDGILSVGAEMKARIFKIRSTDLSVLENEDLAEWLDAFTNLNRVYTDPYKLITLSSRIDTSKNQQYWHQLRNGLKATRQDNLRAKLISEQLDRVVQVAQMTDAYSELNFYIMIFGNSIKEIRQKTHLLEVSDGDVLGLKSLTKNEVCELEFNLHNPNSR